MIASALLRSFCGVLTCYVLYKHLIRGQIAEAIAATKYHGCGCLACTVAALDNAVSTFPELATALLGARTIPKPKRYDCLGREVSHPAVAANAFVEAFRDTMPDGALCPTEAPRERGGRPTLPGDYTVLRYGAARQRPVRRRHRLCRGLTPAPSMH